MNRVRGCSTKRCGRWSPQRLFETPAGRPVGRNRFWVVVMVIVTVVTCSREPLGPQHHLVVATPARPESWYSPAVVETAFEHQAVFRVGSSDLRRRHHCAGGVGLPFPRDFLPYGLRRPALAGASPIEIIKPSKSMQADVMAFKPPCLFVLHRWSSLGFRNFMRS